MERRTRVQDQWTERDRSLLREARRLHGHNQGECADALCALGAAQVGQRTVSAWETGKTEQPARQNLDAIRLYVLETGLDIDAPPQSDGDTSAECTTADPASEVDFAGMSLREVVARRVAGAATPLSKWDLEALKLAYGEADEPSGDVGC